MKKLLYFAIVLFMTTSLCFSARPSIDDNTEPFPLNTPIDNLPNNSFDVPTPINKKFIEEKDLPLAKAYSSLIWKTTPPIPLKQFHDSITVFFIADLKSASAEAGLGWGKYWIKRYKGKSFNYIAIHRKTGAIRISEFDINKWGVPIAIDKGPFSRELRIEQIPFYAIFDKTGRLTYYKSIPPNLSYMDSLLMEY